MQTRACKGEGLQIPSADQPTRWQRSLFDKACNRLARVPAADCQAFFKVKLHEGMYRLSGWQRWASVETDVKLNTAEQAAVDQLPNSAMLRVPPKISASDSEATKGFATGGGTDP